MRVAERVDALDLGSSGIKPWGFKSPLSHKFKNEEVAFES